MSVQQTEASSPVKYIPIPPKRTKRAGVNRPSALTQALDMRDIAARLAIELADTPADTLADKRARAQGIRDLNTVWDNSCERARVIRQVPLPGSLRPDAKRNTPKSRSTLAEPLTPTQ